MFVIVMLLGLRSKLTGVAGITTGAGSRPPSVPIWTHGGPAVVGSGTPPTLASVGQVDGQQLAGRPVLFKGLPVAASMAAVARPEANAGLVIVVVVEHAGRAVPVAGITAGSIFTSLPTAGPVVIVGSATNQDRFQVRSLPAARIWNR